MDEPQSLDEGPNLEAPEQLATGLKKTVIRRIEIKKPDLSHKNLIIHSWKEKILQTIKKNQLTIIEGSTGCGKTTQVPQFLLDEALDEYPSRHCKVIVTQPRKIATKTVAHRVADERYVKIGTQVGYQVSLDKQCDKETRITYMTTGTLLEYIINQKHLSDWTHIIVDEVHERDLETDLLLCTLKKILYESKNATTKLILMSATVNTDKFLQNLKVLCSNNENSTEDGLANCAIRVKCETPYPIEVQYLTSSSRLKWSFDTPGIPDEIYDTAVTFISSLDNLESSRSGLAAGSTTERGAVLVFLPGILEIENMHKSLIQFVTSQTQDLDGKDTFLWEIIPLHSSVTIEEQQKAFQRASPGHRKIVLATNIAESSITLVDMRYVVDFCLTKAVHASSQTTFSSLRLEWCSKFQSTQRKGRVGRVAPGLVYRLVPQHFYEKFPIETVPEMLKSSLENVVLRAKVLDMGTPLDLLSLALDPPKSAGIKRAIANLKEIGALTIYSADINNIEQRVYTPLDGDLTFMGRIMARLPVDVKCSRLIAMGYIFGVLEETIIIAASLSTKSPFSNPYNRRLDAYLSKLTWAESTFSDCFALVNIFKTWCKKFQCRDFHKPNEDEKIWATQFMLQRNVLREIYILVQEIKSRLCMMSIKIISEENPETKDRGLLLKIAIAGGFYPNYFKYIRPNKNEYDRRITQEVDSRNPCSTITFYGFPREQPLELYERHILKYFEIGSQQGATIPYLEVQGPKILLTFDNRSLKIGKVSHGVYRVLKMRHLRHKFAFPVLCRQDEAMEELLKRKELITSKANQKAPEQTPLPDLSENRIDVFVVHVSSSVEFNVIKKNDLDTYNKIISELRNLTAENLRQVTWEESERGDLVFVLEQTDQDESTYSRGRIDLLDYENKLVFVCLIDSGIVQSNTIDEIFVANHINPDSELFKAHALALECRLRGCKLPALTEENGDESDEIKEIVNFVNSHDDTLFFEIYSILDGVLIGDLCANETDEEPDSLRTLLLETNVLEVVDEPVESIRNHNARNSRLVRSENPNRQREMLSQQVSNKVPRSYITPPDDPNRSRLITLKGPENPLEMAFKTLCRSAFMKVVSIEGNSVNSVSIDSYYLKPMSRLLVAGSVTCSDRTGDVIARETTLLPPIPNLTGLLTMLFCPCLELRVDDSCKKYTGAIAGLGLNPISGEPIYDEHDIEIFFDTVIDNNDVNLVNSIRMTMNYILRQENERDLANLRMKCQKELIDLLTKPREAMEEVWPENPHCWGELPYYATVLIPKNEDEDTEDRPPSRDVFELHQGIQLGVTIE